MYVLKFTKVRTGTFLVVAMEVVEYCFFLQKVVEFRVSYVLHSIFHPGTVHAVEFQRARPPFAPRRGHILTHLETTIVRRLWKRPP